MPAKGTNPAPSEEQIRARAYEIYLRRGCQSGHEESDWLQAEQELRAKFAEPMPLGEPELQESSTRSPEKSNGQSRNRESLSRN